MQVAVIAPLLVVCYAASFGPAIVLVDSGCLTRNSVQVANHPLLMLHHRSPAVVYNAFGRYARWWGDGISDYFIGTHIIWEFDTFGRYVPGRTPIIE